MHVIGFSVRKRGRKKYNLEKSQAKGTHSVEWSTYHFYPKLTLTFSLILKTAQTELSETQFFFFLNTSLKYHPCNPIPITPQTT